MTRYFKIAALALLAFLIGGRAIRIERTNPPVEGEIEAPPEIKAALRRACYDCHSNETVWPWYSDLAPISWLLAHDVSEGREELNFSSWGKYADKRKAKKLKESAEEIAEGEMPPWYYEVMHPSASLSTTERNALIEWAKQGTKP
ncbi:MAG: heme-binding domain-containing protein [Deltaproteobacteria bacterium]|nr:heme-binding domain-containing protein [Deltaproteobacteria bacterium]